MDRLAVKHRLLDKGLTLVALSTLCDLPYDRLIKIVNGYRPPRTEELNRVAIVLDLSVESLAQGGTEDSKAAVHGKRRS